MATGCISSKEINVWLNEGEQEPSFDTNELSSLTVFYDSLKGTLFRCDSQADLSLFVHDNLSEKVSSPIVYQLKIQKAEPRVKHGVLTVFLADVATPMVGKHQAVLAALNSKLNLETMIPKSVEKITKANVELALQKGLNLGYRIDIGKARCSNSPIKPMVVEFMRLNHDSEVNALLFGAILKSNNKYIINEYLKHIVEDLQDIDKLEDCLKAGADINHLYDHRKTVLDKLVQSLFNKFAVKHVYDQITCRLDLELDPEYRKKKSDLLCEDDSSKNDITKESTTAEKSTFLNTNSYKNEDEASLFFKLLSNGARLNNSTFSTQYNIVYAYLFDLLNERGTINQHTLSYFEFLAIPPYEMFDGINKTLLDFEKKLKNALTQLVTGKSDYDKLRLLKPYIDSSIKFDSVICYQLCWNCMSSFSVENMKPHIEAVIAKGCVNILKFMLATAAADKFFSQFLEIINPLMNGYTCHSKIHYFWNEEGLDWKKYLQTGQLPAVKFDRLPC